MANNHVFGVQFGVAGVITPNATTYLYPGNGITTTNEPRIAAPRTGTLKNMYIFQRLASGNAGRTDVYTVRVNGVDTTIICTLNNATSGNDTTNTKAVAAGDQISIKLVSNNALDASADVGVSLEIEFSQ
jgi:hypothetical protein